MTNQSKPNLRKYNGKDRIYVQHGTIKGLSKELRWNAEAGEYKMPATGSPWVARRTELNAFGQPQRKQKIFVTFEAAKSWLFGAIQSQGTFATFETTLPKGVFEFGASIQTGSVEQIAKGKKFSELVESFRKRRYPKLSQGTAAHYDQLFRLHFEPLMGLEINLIGPKVVDEWIDHLFENIRRFPQARLRKSFEKELTLLGIVLRFYDDQEDDPQFKFPIKSRHRAAAEVRKESEVQDRDLSYEEFQKVSSAFDCLKCKHAMAMKALFVVQYRQALRVSEAAAIQWEDVKLDFRNPSSSSVRICRHIEWSRASGVESRLTGGFKNSKGSGGFKDQPIFPETFQAFKELHFIGAKGLVFKDVKGVFFSYRSIQSIYERAFNLAGVEYKGTHQLRHGGCRLVFNSSGGDRAVAGQILGNRDAETIDVYAKRKVDALNEVSQRDWARFREDQAVTSASVGEDKVSSL